MIGVAAATTDALIILGIILGVAIIAVGVLLVVHAERRHSKLLSHIDDHMHAVIEKLERKP